MNYIAQFHLSATMFDECVIELLKMKRDGAAFEAMRSYLATKPYMASEHWYKLHRLISKWEDYFQTTGRRYSQPATVGQYQRPAQKHSILYNTFSIPLGQKRKKVWPFGRKHFMLLINRVLVQATYFFSSGQKAKRPNGPNPGHLRPNGLACFSDLESIDNQLVTGGKTKSGQKATLFPTSGEGGVSGDGSLFTPKS